MKRTTVFLGDRTIEMTEALQAAYEHSDGVRTTRSDIVRLAIAALYKREQDGGVLAGPTRG
jgi:hypothetical protein